MIWRDASGRALGDYPCPSVAVDVALLTLDAEGRLAVLLHERGEEYAAGRLSLPGTFVHDAIVAAAVAWARELYRAAPDPRRLIGPEFTLLDLQRVHEAVEGRPLLKDAFRRRMRPLLVETGEL